MRGEDAPGALCSATAARTGGRVRHTCPPAGAAHIERVGGGGRGGERLATRSHASRPERTTSIGKVFAERSGNLKGVRGGRVDGFRTCFIEEGCVC